MPAASPRVEVRRAPHRASYDFGAIAGILDEAMICHVGFVADGGHPVVIPTMYARCGDVLYLHGARSSRMLKALRSGAELCLTVTVLDGLVLARSALHHSMNYRSVVVVGRAEEVTDAEEKVTSMRALIEHVAPGRWSSIRRPSLDEFNRTLVLKLPLEEASAKVRTGPPVDDPEDLRLEVWAGVVPIVTKPGAPVPDPAMDPLLDAPEHVLALIEG